MIDIKVGKYAGKRGEVVGKINSTRDGLIYKVKIGDKVVQILEKNIYPEIVFAEPSFKEGDVVEFCGKDDDIIERDPDESKVPGHALCFGKYVAISLIYDHEGVEVANIVFQGQYAVVKLTALRHGLKGLNILH